MKKSVIDQDLLALMVSLYNETIQTYFYFPDVIICGRQRLERQSFDQLVVEEFVAAYKADSFGRYYRLSKKGEDFLFTYSFRRRQKHSIALLAVQQQPLPFAEALS